MHGAEVGRRSAPPRLRCGKRARARIGRIALPRALIATAAACVTALACAQTADAACRGCSPYPAFAPGFIGAAPIVGAVPYGAYYGYGPSYSYQLPATYYGPGMGCYWRKQRVWDWDGQYFVIRRLQVCY